MALTDKQRRFVDEYLVDLNATQAAIRAGYSAKRADAIGHENLRKPEVAAHLAERQQALQERTEITQEMVLKRWWEIATADPNDLVQYRRYCCRHCWGIDHAYQWTEAEYEKAQREAESEGKESPDCNGGFGFDMNRAPHPECPECGGNGFGKMHVNDTRKLAGGARLLYAGVKSGKDGLELKMHDQMKALEAVARHIGMFPTKVELTGKDGGPVKHQNMPPDLSNLSDDELANLEAIAAKLGQSAGPERNSG
ncbi:terminase small subunit [Burkholderia cepacia]|uniref:terminase small subunit n=1 Tax=Burkholderia cepacia TaxID=292 RepID=UPI00298FDA93|nr:terminase small subunit [Burkholderia cepacia]